MLELLFLTGLLFSGTLLGFISHYWKKGGQSLQLRHEKQYVLTEAIQLLAITRLRRP